MEDAKINMFKNRLVKVMRHLGKQARRQNITCYRLYDHDLPEYPLCIEYYGQYLYIAEYRRRHGMTDQEHEHWVNETLMAISEILQVHADHIYLKLRQRKQGRQGQYQKLNTNRHEFTVTENNLKYIDNLSDYLDTGLFLDHRITRQMVREESEQKKVLNLFAYTGSFSVYAASGGASEVMTVDLSNTYLNWAKANMQLNGFDDIEKYKYMQADVKAYLPTIESGRYDIIVLDPPTFSNSKRMDDILDVQADHPMLINHCLNGLKAGGSIYFSTNARKFILDEKSIKASSIKDITRATTPFDFEGRMNRLCYLIIK